MPLSRIFIIMAILFIIGFLVISTIFVIIKTLQLHSLLLFTAYIIVLSCLFILIKKKYNNPYRLYILFGKKGSFKSTFMIKEMLKYKKKGWNIYSDIPDLLVNGARIISAKDLETFTPEQNSAVFLDEVGLTYDNRKFKTFSDGANEWYKFQRKYKCVVWMNSQHLDIDIKIRTLADGLFLCNGIAGVCGIMRPIKRSITLTEPTSEAESRIADKLEFRCIFFWKFIWGPRYFKYFDSFSAPHRDPIPYSEVIADVKDFRKPLHLQLSSSHQKKKIKRNSGDKHKTFDRNNYSLRNSFGYPTK